MAEQRQDVTWSGRHAIVTMPAEIDLINATGVGDQLSAAASGSPEVITIDMSATTFCDSAGIRVLARAHEQAAASGAEVRIAIGDSPVRRILQLTGLDQVVPVYHDVRQSLSKLVLAHEGLPYPGLGDAFVRPRKFRAAPAYNSPSARLRAAPQFLRAGRCDQRQPAGRVAKQVPRTRPDASRISMPMAGHGPRSGG